MPTTISLAPLTASATELVAMANSPLPIRRKPYLVCVPGALSCKVIPVRITVPNALSKNGSRSQIRTSWPANAQSAPQVLPTAPPPKMAIGARRSSSTSTNSITSLADGLAAILRKTLRPEPMRTQALPSSLQKNTTHKTPNSRTETLIPSLS